jgi:lipid-A-disaccharide synthase-like uncharacterized protein
VDSSRAEVIARFVSILERGLLPPFFFLAFGLLGGSMGIVLDFTDAKTDVIVVGALVLGVYVAIQVIHWIQLVLIQREADREFLDRYY